MIMGSRTLLIIITLITRPKTFSHRRHDYCIVCKALINILINNCIYIHYLLNYLYCMLLFVKYSNWKEDHVLAKELQSC